MTAADPKQTIHSYLVMRRQWIFGQLTVEVLDGVE